MAIEIKTVQETVDTPSLPSFQRDYAAEAKRHVEVWIHHHSDPDVLAYRRIQRALVERDKLQLREGSERASRLLGRIPTTSEA